ncbi:MAG: hypothetical protein JJU00_08050, partial [Opitutales bacterium]|nr:hypothetical protein [Opitutales bacterium]
MLPIRQCLVRAPKVLTCAVLFFAVALFLRGQSAHAVTPQDLADALGATSFYIAPDGDDAASG